MIKNGGMITAHRYDELSGMLTVEFKDGRAWTHTGVPQILYEQFTASSAPMAFWAVAIRQAAQGMQKLYPVTRVTTGVSGPKSAPAPVAPTIAQGPKHPGGR